MQPAPGSLLIASETLRDPNFARCLVLVLDANPEGCIGVILNRPSEVPVGQVLPPWQDLTAPPDVLFRGGPVDLDAALALAVVRDAPAPEGWRSFDGSAAGLGMLDLDAAPEGFLGRLDALRIYAGYAGWGAGQLEGEIREGAWHVVPALPTDLFNAAPDLLWGRVLRRQPPPLALLATLPEDAGLN